MAKNLRKQNIYYQYCTLYLVLRSHRKIYLILVTLLKRQLKLKLRGWGVSHGLRTDVKKKMRKNI